MESPTPLARIQNRIAPLQAALNDHPLYAAIRTPEHLRLFMQSHVFAVWDFMSLLKALQATLTCVCVPWTPTAWPESRRFINEIVLGEESDVFEGRAISHFELYLEAMQAFEADTGPIHALLEDVAAKQPVAFRVPKSTPEEAQAFLHTTFALIRSGSLPAIAAGFTFGREDAIPGIFRALVRELDSTGGGLSKFVWYLERHIQVDGEDHGPMSLRMVADLCGDDPGRWDEAAQAAEEAIRARLALWDGILRRIEAAQARR